MLSSFSITCIRCLSSTTASITRARRLIAARVYPTILVQPDGSSINIRYHEPRKIIKLPLNLNHLSEKERKERIEKRKPKIQIKIEEEIDDNFDAKKYLFLKKGGKTRS